MFSALLFSETVLTKSSLNPESESACISTVIFTFASYDLKDEQ